jgi:hypothetical protein
MRVLFATSLLLGLSIPRADAQIGASWLIIPTTSATATSRMDATARAFHRELWDRGIDVWSLERAANRFEEMASAPAAQLSEGELQEWEQRSNAAILPLASGDYAEALIQLAKAQELSRRAPEQLNRDAIRAQRVLDTCLFMVRALQQTGSASLAEGLARECRELVLVGEPSSRMHPPEVRQTLARIDEGRAKQTGAIFVTSNPPSCDVRVNGLKLGETPLEVTELYPGRYRVQVECANDSPGRVHETEVRFERVDVFVDARFDEVVRTRPLLHLRYENAQAELRDRVSDAETVAQVVPAGALLLMHESEADIVELVLLRGEPAELHAMVRVKGGAEGPTPGDLALASRALIDGDCTDFSGPEPRTLSCRDETPPVEGPTARDLRLARRTPRGQFVTGITLASAGSATLVTGYLLMLPRANTAEEWIAQIDSATETSDQQRWLNLGSAILGTSIAGSAALVAAMPLALPQYEKPPWWAWLSGGLGLGLTAASVALGVTAYAEPSDGCTSGAIARPDAQTCVRRGEHVAFAVLTGLTAAPALTVPLVYLFRKSDKNVEPTVEVGRSRGYVGVRGRF